jgi:hypothetical protein
MAAGGLACTGGTGEDYAVPGWNALVLQSTDPHEFFTLYQRVKADPSDLRALRRHGVSTAKQYAWGAILQRTLLPRIARGTNERARVA